MSNIVTADSKSPIRSLKGGNYDGSRDSATVPRCDLCVSRAPISSTIPTKGNSGFGLDAATMSEGILQGLNAAQYAAVSSSADVLQVLAPPGSGKTKVLTSRVAYMLQELNYKPWNIICLTFTIKSAREMKERLAKLIGNGTEQRLILGTFHSVCRRYLVAYGHLIGVKKDFGIADSSDTKSILTRLIKRHGLQIDVKKARARISNAKSTGLTCNDLRRLQKPKQEVEEQEIIALFDAYQQHLKTSNLLDYDDLLVRCVELLEQHPACVSNVEAVLVDEFQDTNVVQLELLKLFAATRKRVTTVGDPDQSIYGWRSAEIKNLKRMRVHWPDTLVINLEDNYRSSGAILLAAQEVIEQDTSRPVKYLSPTHCPGTPPVLRWLPSAEAEAAWIVSEITRSRCLTGKMLDYGDFAILLRTAALSRLIESAMTRHGIPYRMVGGHRFFDRLEIRLLLDYMRVVSSPENNDALIRIINNPSRGIGATSLQILTQESEKAKCSLWTYIGKFLMGNTPAQNKLTKPVELALNNLRNLILTLQGKMSDDSLAFGPEQILRLVIKKLDFKAHLEKTNFEDHESKWANVEELVSQASDYRIISPDGDYHFDHDATEELPYIDGLEQRDLPAAQEALSKFLGNVALATEVAREDAQGLAATQNPVTITTIHAAKGLEWPVVFVPSAHAGIIPHSRAENHDEERRLLYVAMTRAQGMLCMSWPTSSSQREEVKLSPFLSTKEVKRLSSSQGPSINADLVLDLCAILRRTAPSKQDIEQASVGLESREDDTWPLNAEEAEKQRLQAGQDSERRGNVSLFARASSAHERARPLSNTTFESAARFSAFSRVDVGTVSTMDNHTSFSLPSGTIGFSTASAELRVQAQARAVTESKDDGSSKVQLKPGMRAKKVTRPAAKPTNLLAFWGKDNDKPGPTGSAPKGDTADSSVPLARRNLKEPLGILSANKSAEVTSNIANRKRERSSGSRTPEGRKRFVLLSSSPPRVEESTESLPKESLSPIRRHPPYPYRNASTTPIAPACAAKKTLGLRRSMGGWGPREKRPFITPVAVSMDDVRVQST